MKENPQAARKYGKFPIAGGLFFLGWAGFMTHQCIVHGGMTHRTFWVTWQQWTPIIIGLWIMGLSSLAFGVRRGIKEMMLDTQLKSTQEEEHEEHRTTGSTTISDRADAV